MKTPMNLVGAAIFTGLFTVLAVTAVEYTQGVPSDADDLDGSFVAATVADRLVSRPGAGWWEGAPLCDTPASTRSVTELGLREEPDCMHRWAAGATNVLSHAKVEALANGDLGYAHARRTLGAETSGADLRLTITQRGAAEADPLLELGPAPAADAVVAAWTRVATLWSPALDGPLDVSVVVEAWPRA